MDFMAIAGVQSFDAKSGENFLATLKPKTYRYDRSANAIRHFTNFLSGTEYSYKIKTATNCPNQFADIFDKYIKKIERNGNSSSTIKVKREQIIKVIVILETLGAILLKDLCPALLYKTMDEITNFVGYASTLREFLRYLYKEQITETDLSVFVPRAYKKKTVPSVYSREETRRLLDSFNSETPSGLRGAAFAILALRLGMRAGDIANLKLDDIDYTGKAINFTQRKTNASHCLELIPEVERTIIAYLENARPASDSPYIFLSLLPPYRSIEKSTIFYVISEQMKRAGIEQKNRRRGPHSLRATFASELVEEGVSYDVVRTIMGHEEPTALKKYVQFDIKQLRTCAIEVPRLSGRLAALSTSIGGKI